MKKLFDDIYSFTLPLPFPTTPLLTLYYIDGSKPALIDTGMGDLKSIGIIMEELKSIKKDIKDISLIINTHEHIEHFGGDHKLREASGAEVIASGTAAFKIENLKKINMDLKQYLPDYEEDVAAEMEREIDYDLQFDESVIDTKAEEGDVIEAGSLRLQVIATPGHTHGHICLYDKDRKILFSGDHILGRGSTFVGYDYREIISRRIIDIFNNSFEAPDNLSLYMDSIKKLQSLDLSVILPSHGETVMEPHKRLEMEYKKKERRSKMFLRVLEKYGEMTIKELTGRVYGANKDGLMHRGSALGYLAMLNKKGIIEAYMGRDDLYLKMKNG